MPVKKPYFSIYFLNNSQKKTMFLRVDFTLKKYSRKISPSKDKM